MRVCTLCLCLARLLSIVCIKSIHFDFFPLVWWNLFSTFDQFDETLDWWKGTRSFHSVHFLFFYSIIHQRYTPSCAIIWTLNEDEHDSSERNTNSTNFFASSVCSVGSPACHTHGVMVRLCGWGVDKEQQKYQIYTKHSFWAPRSLHTIIECDLNPFSTIKVFPTTQTTGIGYCLRIRIFFHVIRNFLCL